MLSIGNRSMYVSVHVLMGFRGVNVIPVPFTPRFDVLLWDYWTVGSVYPTIWYAFVGLLDLRVRLPHVSPDICGTIRHHGLNELLCYKTPLWKHGIKRISLVIVPGLLSEPRPGTD